MISTPPRQVFNELDWHMQITINILLNIPRRKFLINPYKANYFLSSSIWDNTVFLSLRHSQDLGCSLIYTCTVGNCHSVFVIGVINLFSFPHPTFKINKYFIYVFIFYILLFICNCIIYNIFIQTYIYPSNMRNKICFNR